MSADTLYATPVNDYPLTADIERPEPAGPELAALETRIRELLTAQDAVLVAHYYVDDALQELAADPEGPGVVVAGRIVSWRPHGKTVFAHLADAQSRLQAYFRRDELGDAVWAHTWRYYDAAGRTTTTVDAEGYVTALTWSATGEVLKNGLSVLGIGAPDEM